VISQAFVHVGWRAGVVDLREAKIIATLKRYRPDIQADAERNNEIRRIKRS